MYVSRQELGEAAHCKSIKQRERINSKNTLENKPVFSRVAAPSVWARIYGSKQNALALVYRLMQLNKPEWNKEFGVEPGK